MANSLAITAVTGALRNLLQTMAREDDLGVSDLQLTTQSPDKARQSNDKRNQLNIFLYRVAPNTSNQDRETNTSLALSLYYFITAYGKDDDDTWSHLLLGNALRLLTLDRELNSEQLKAGVNPQLPGRTENSLPTKVRLLLETPSEEELVRIWSLFQTPYRLSIAYQAEVILPCKT